MAASLPETVRVRLFGGLEVEGLAGDGLGSRKQRTLLRLLAVSAPQWVSADRIVDALWGDAGSVAPKDPMAQVRVLVSRLRQVLGADRVERSEAGYRLRADWVDAAALPELVEQAERSLAAGQPASAAAAADAALALARGPLLADEPDAQWAAESRATADRWLTRARLAGAQAALDAGQPASAVRRAEAARAADPLDEQAARLLMTGHARSGNTGLALAVFADLRRRLGDELGTDPSLPTQGLHAAILREELVADSGTTPNVQASGSLPLVGRAEAWARLDEALAAAAERCVVAAVMGPAGIGKTRLATDWSTSAGAAGSVVLVGRCIDAAGLLPLQAPLDALHRHLATLSPGQVQELLGPDRSALAPLLGSTSDEPQTAPGDPASARVRLFTALLAVLVRLSTQRPTVLVLEDIHLADASTLAWLSLVERRPAAGSLLVLLTTRGDRPGPGGAARRIELGPLDLQATEELVGTDRAPQLYARSGGHPLFLVELARSAPGELPHSIVEAVESSLASTGPAARTLRAAAVLGPEVDLGLLAEVLDAAALPLLDDLEAGVRVGLLEVRGTAFTFAHELVREGLVAGTSAPRVTAVHRRAAAVLAGKPDVDPARLVHHARAGGDALLAATALVEAAAVASRRFDHEQAERLLTEALELHPDPVARLARARVRVIREDLLGAQEDAMRVADETLGAEGLEVAGWAAYYRRDFAAAHRLAAQAEQRLSLGDPLTGSVLALAGRVDHADGHLVEAGDRLGRAVSDGGPRTPAVARLWLAGWTLDQGRVDDAERLLADVEDDPTLSLHPFATAHRALIGASAAAQRGRIAEALALLDRVDLEVERRHLVHFAGRPTNYRAWIARNLGEADRADDLNVAAAEAATARGLREPQVQAQLDLADGALRGGELAAAAERLSEVQDDLAGEYAFAWRARLRARLLMARLALADGRADDATALAEGVLADATAFGLRRHGVLAELLALQARGRALDDGGRDRADVLLAELDVVAAPESWWVTAALADSAAEPRWVALAETRAARLAQWGRSAL